MSDQPTAGSPRAIRAGLVASVGSIVWTATTSAIAIVIGLMSASVVLVAFGAVGTFDMIGSITLVVHFRHALTHDEVSERHERLAHLVVATGMLIVGLATCVASVIRLAAGAHTSESVVGVVVSAASIAALGGLGIWKLLIGRRIPSAALRTDGMLSLTGCGTAACAVAGLALNDAFGWSWVDPVAAMCVAVTALAVAITSLRSLAGNPVGMRVSEFRSAERQ